MKKSDLKTGMYFITSTGKKRIVLLGTRGGDQTSAVRLGSSSSKDFERLVDYYPLAGWDDSLKAVNSDSVGDVMHIHDEYGVHIWSRPEESKLELVKGLWYITKSKYNVNIFCFNGHFSYSGEPLGYGIVDLKNPLLKSSFLGAPTICGWSNIDRLAGDEEVRMALLSYATVLFKGVTDFKSAYCDTIFGKLTLDKTIFEYTTDKTLLISGNTGCLFLDGKWATPVIIMSKSDAEQKLNCIIR